jgi:predicted O-methyltransferase YrrM
MSLLSHDRLRRQCNPRYVYDRTRQALYERGHPDDPWLTPAAIRMLTTLLRRPDRGIEFGAGRSTLWLAQRVAHLTSVEQDPAWHGRVGDRLARAGLANVDLILAPADLPDEQGADSQYVAPLRRLAPGSLDFALIAGAYRAHAARLAMTRLRPGGLMIIDNVNWYLPSVSRAPASRPVTAGPDDRWADIVTALADWRLIWTGSGVWDTALFIRPS